MWVWLLSGSYTDRERGRESTQSREKSREMSFDVGLVYFLDVSSIISSLSRHFVFQHVASYLCVHECMIVLYRESNRERIKVSGRERERERKLSIGVGLICASGCFVHQRQPVKFFHVFESLCMTLYI